MDDIHYRFKTVDQLAISLSIVFEFVRLSFEQFKDVVGRITRLKPVNKRVLGRVYHDPGLLGIVGEGRIEDKVEDIVVQNIYIGSGGNTQRY